MHCNAWFACSAYVWIQRNINAYSGHHTLALHQSIHPIECSSAQQIRTNQIHRDMKRSVFLQTWTTVSSARTARCQAEVEQGKESLRVRQKHGCLTWKPNNQSIELFMLKIVNPGLTESYRLSFFPHVSHCLIFTLGEELFMHSKISRVKRTPMV